MYYGSNIYVGVGFTQEAAGPWSENSLPAHLLFHTCAQGQSDPVEKMRLTSYGYLGIATKTPTTHLHVEGLTQSQGYIPTGNVAPSHGIYSSTGTDVAISTDTTPRVIINQDGYVGIGTVSPTELLYVNGNAQVQGNLTVSGNLTLLGSVLSDFAVNGLIQTIGYTVATLPAAGTAGRRAYVTDASSPSFLNTITGGGSVVCPVFDDGSSWVAG